MSYHLSHSVINKLSQFVTTIAAFCNKLKLHGWRIVNPTIRSISIDKTNKTIQSLVVIIIIIIVIITIIIIIILIIVIQTH